jgi:hypothetical protein
MFIAFGDKNQGLSKVCVDCVDFVLLRKRKSRIWLVTCSYKLFDKIEVLYILRVKCRFSVESRNRHVYG